MSSGRSTLDLSRCFTDAAEIYRKNFFTLFLAAIFFDIFSIASLLILAGPLCGGMINMTLHAVRHPDEPIRLGDLFSAFHRFWPLVALFFIETVVGIVSMFFFIVPGVIIAALWLFPMYLLLDLNLTVTDSLATSARIVLRRGFWINFALALILILISIVPHFIPYIGWLIGWFLTPLAWLINTSAYIQEVREQPDTDALLPHGFPVIPAAT